MAQTNRIKPLVLTTVDTSEISAITWIAFDDDGIEGACFFLRITNDSDTDVIITYNGADDHEFIAADSTIEVNFQTNSSPSGYVSKLKKGTVISVSGSAGTGLVYLAGYYNEIL